jgi:hypothetical protein
MTIPNFTLLAPGGSLFIVIKQIKIKYFTYRSNCKHLLEVLLVMTTGNEKH